MSKPLAVFLCAAAFLGCGDDKGDGPTLRRSKDAGALVVVVDRTADGVPFQNEVEPNDSCEAAKVLKAPAGIRGQLASEDDLDFYKVDPGEAKNLAVLLSGIDKVDLMIEAIDAEGKVIARSDRGPKKVSEGFPTFPVKGGGTVCFKVREYISRSRRRNKNREKRTTPSPTYDLTITPLVETEEGAEVEPNDDAQSAPEVLLGDEVTGFIGSSGDVDFWKLSLAGFSASYSLDIDVSGVPGVTLSLEVLDASGEPVLSRTAAKGEDLAVRNLVPAEGQTHYYAKLYGKRTNPEKAYRMRVSSRMLAPAAEIEPNDTAETAVALRIDPVATEGERAGYLDPGDVDTYVLSGAGGKLLNLSAVPQSGGDLALEIIVGGIPTQTNLGAAGATEKLTGITIPAGSDIHIKVTRSGKSTDLFPYTLNWSLL